MNTLFIYGTLLNDEILSVILNRHLKKCDAYLQGYRRVQVLGEVYPAIFPDKSSRVDGALIMDLNDEDLVRLDNYEGLHYARKAVSPCLPNETCRDSMAYVLNRSIIICFL